MSKHIYTMLKTGPGHSNTTTVNFYYHHQVITITGNWALPCRNSNTEKGRYARYKIAG